MGPLWPQLAWTSSTNCEKVVCMTRGHPDLRRHPGPSTGHRPQPATGSPTYRVLADRIRAAVLDGRLAVGTGLPSERELAGGTLAVPDHGRRGLRAAAGTGLAGLAARLREPAPAARVRPALAIVGRADGRSPNGRQSRPAQSRWAQPDGRMRQRRRSTPVASSAGRTVSAGTTAPSRSTPRGRCGAGSIDLTTACLPAPAEPLAAAVAAAAAELPRYAAGDGYLPFGLPVLREVDRRPGTRAAGVPTTAEQILITSGAQHAFTLIVGELSAPGDRVLIECPTYPVALDALRAGRRECRLRSAWPSRPATASATRMPGMSTFSRSTLRQMAPRLGYLIPDFQNPTGALMDEQTREAMVAAARARRTLLLVDESFRDVPFPQTAAAAAADGRLRRRQPGAVAGVGVQVVLGRAAGRLDPQHPAAGPTTGRSPGAGRHVRSRCWTSWW